MARKPSREAIRRIGKVYLLALVLGCSAFAQNAKNPFLAPLKDPAFYIGTAEFAAASFADVHSTKACERNFTCVEAYKGHDSYGYIGPQIAFAAMGSYGCSLMLHGHHRWRWACLAIPVALSIQHWKDASTIYKNPKGATP